MAQAGTFCELAADPLALRHVDVAADQHWPKPVRLLQLRLAVEGLFDQAAEMAGALRVADQDDAAALVVLLQVFVPGGFDVAVGDVDRPLR